MSYPRSGGKASSNHASFSLRVRNRERHEKSVVGAEDQVGVLHTVFTHPFDGRRGRGRLGRGHAECNMEEDIIEKWEDPARRRR